MNVTSKGYYTSKYLDNVTRSRYVGLPDNENNHYETYSRSQHRVTSPCTATNNSGDSSPSSVRSRTPVAISRTPLSRPKTPSQNMKDTNVAKLQSRDTPDGSNVSRSPLGSPVTESSAKDGAIYDPDYLEQGITPADLHVLQNKNPRLYPYRNPRDKALIRGKSKRNAADYFEEDYYIKQKQRHDESSFKPKFYTHKTFKDVFTDEQEMLEKYNPMESVFDDPDAKREQEQNQILKKAFRVIQTKLGKENYNNYDYYKNSNLTQEQKREIFVNSSNKNCDNDNNEEVDLNNKVYVTEEERKQLKQNKKFKNVWKNKLKKVSKDLSQDYSNNLVQQNEKLENTSTADPIVLDPENEAPLANSSNVEFHPLWNYILSWLVYDQTADTFPSPSEENLHNSKSKAKQVVIKDAVKFDMRNIKRNYRGVVNKWGQPASTLFNNRQLIPQNTKGFTKNTGTSVKAVPPGILDDLSQEFVIEVDDDYGDGYADEELYYDPTSRQLQGHPPNSFSSMIKQSSFNKQRRSTLLDSSNGPVAIISNINTLIKNIKIMRIIFAPIDIIALNFPNLQTLVIMLELVIFLWLLYELSLLIDALCMMVKAVCAPMIAMGRFMNRIM